MKLCAVDGCNRPVLRRSWCSMHYWRWYRHGTPGNELEPLRFSDPLDSIAARIEFTDECWVWAGARSARYGDVRDGQGRTGSAHRVLWELVVEPVPEGLELDHLCRNTWCVNPDHLEPVTHAVNSQRGAIGEASRRRQVGKTHCPQGHPYDEVNTWRDKKGFRHCRTCHRERELARKERLRAASRR